MGRTLTTGALLLAMALAGCSDSNNDNDDPPAPPPPPPPPPATTTTVSSTLSPAQVIDGGAGSGSGSATVTFNEDDGSVSGTVTLTGLQADAVSLNRGFAGQRGPELVALEQSSGGEWTFASDAAITQADLDALPTGGLYLVAVTAANPDGALRGQLLPGDLEVIFMPLSGDQQVPPVATSARGRGALTLDPDTGSIVLHVSTSGVSDATAAHIHDGLAGETGPVVVELLQDPDDADLWFTEDAELDQVGLDRLAEGGLYVNVHSPANPGGEIRGQIEPPGLDIFFARLTGDDVVPPVTTSGSGMAATTLDPDTGTLTLHVNLVDLDDVQSVTVNQAPVMQNGPAILTLEQDPDELTHWSLSNVTLTESQFQALNNQGLYVTAATASFPDGEVRGQLIPEESSAGGGDAFEVTAIDPVNGSTVESLPETVTATFSRDLLASSVSTDSVEVTASGGDGSFGDGNETSVGVLDVSVAGSELTADLDTAADADDVYQIRLDGSSTAPITDGDGVVLDGDEDGNPGGDFISTFTVTTPSTTPSLSDLQAEIFTPSCAVSGCHTGSSPPQGLNLSAGQSFVNLVNVPSTEVPALDRVEPNDPDNSYLVQKVEGTAAVGGRMPLGGPPLTNAQIQDIREWILAGAPDDGG